ncbi:1-phosphatidylinositol-3-phosphate 5-kinase FAB1B-like isoform X2 [Papaver somniferum]|uniref:1-phosphatidylinositol-3-phosphate 5-kinase FAB1B-like isoform X2 n=1 Tax=Papaver somniferum TaxID=3469 RepID=UPI000E704AE2|nr:1-phosphatidylinositol-3-phosphate 5-kinase FAB1B-like isoform X2 [Papaver somniferum]
MENSTGKTLAELVEFVKSWISRRNTEPANYSRDFWMPDHSCRVCYECDTQFTIINRRHHCRLCGRVFCGKCTANSIPVPSAAPNNKANRDDCDRIRVCIYCFKQWEQEVASVVVHNGTHGQSRKQQGRLSPTVSTTSFTSTKSSVTGNSSSSIISSVPYSAGNYQFGPYGSGLSIDQSTQMDLGAVADNKPDRAAAVAASTSTTTGPTGEDTRDASPDPFEYFMNRSEDDDEDDDIYGYGVYRSNSEPTRCPLLDEYYAPLEDDTTDCVYGPHSDEENNITKDSLVNRDLDCQGLEDESRVSGEENGGQNNGDECDTASVDGVDAEPLDFENNGLLWLPPEPEDLEDDREAVEFGNDDDEDAAGEWKTLRSCSSFGSGEYRSRDRSSEEHKKAMKNEVDKHFKALVSQLLQVENLIVGEEGDKESWLEIITSLSLEAATVLKPDTSEGGGMDPGGYVKIKCLACGRRTESIVVKGVVCKKNVSNRRMTSKIEKPRFLILGGALEYQRVSNHLSSFDTLLQQETDHLKMAVAKIVAHHPNVLLVEKSVSRFAQEYLFEKDISLVLNIKRPLLERIARCTGAQIVPSVDHLSTQKPGYCEAFRVEKFLEAHGSAGQGGKKLVKTLMFFEGCPKPLGCTILLKGANGDELKKVKHVLHYSVFAAYHLALETSFLADEGASLPELPLRSPITIALPDKPSSIDRSISTIPGFVVVPPTSKPQGSPLNIDSQSETTSPAPPCKRSLVFSQSSGLPKFPTSQYTEGIGGNPLAKSAELLGGKEANDPHINETATFKSTSFQQDRNHLDEPGSSKEEFPPSPSDHRSILVSLSIRSVWKGTVCERAHLLRMKYYGSFDKTLGRFLRDDLFAQSYRCSSCEMPSEAHVHSYTHRQGSLTISVKKFPEFLLPGERDGKIWMWHRCLLCPRPSGFPPAIRRVVMSEPAQGLSFGKFLELSFSNHAAANRVANCGHSLHRDCLRFYGLGNMVACFRYASINVHSVYLPPSKLDFSCGNPEWLQKEVNQVVDRAELLFTEVLNALRQIAIKRIGTLSVKVAESRRHIGDLEELLQKEKVEYEESLQKVINRGVRKGEIVTDILEINRLRVQLLFHSYVWDHRLIRAAKSDSSNLQEGLNSSIQKCAEESLSTIEKLVSTNSTSKQGDSTLTDVGCDKNSKLEGSGEQVDSLPKDNTTGPHLSSSLSLKAPADPLETGIHVRRAISEGQFPIVANLDAAWTGENLPGSVILEVNSSAHTEVAADSLAKGETDTERLKLEKRFEELGVAEVTESHRPILPVKVADNSDENTGWIGMPFLNLYRSYNRSSSENNTSKLEPLNDYNPVYVSSFCELERQGGSRFILPIGANETVVPIYDEEATSIIAHALVSKDYYVQMSDEWERPKDGAESSVLLPLYDSLNLQSPFQSFEETASESLRSLGTMDSSILSMSGSRSSMISDPLVYTKTSHVRVAFSDDGPLGKVKYAVTCYYAKGFEALRRTCCPSELDFVRSLSRCSDWNAQGGKSNAYFAKSLDDRFIIKGLTKTELESFIKFAPEYFKYLSESIGTRSPTCLAKILGVYQVTTKHLKGGKEQKMDVLVMENLLFKRSVTRLYDLKGSSRSRYNPDASGKNKVLLDQNLIEAMPTSPIFLGNKAKRLLERAVWNDTSFLASIDVMDYSLLVGVDEEKNELVLGIIDFIRQYTWDKHLETWVKASGFLGGSKNESPTVISPKQYKKRFRKAMSTYFLMVPDQWSPPTIIPSSSHSDLESLHGGGTYHD